MQMGLSEICQAVTPKKPVDTGDDVWVSRVCTDSRCVQPGDLFVALSGTRCDGHDFVVEALQAGATALLVERLEPSLLKQVPIVLVDNCIQALGRLASAFRSRFSGQVVGITGTAGKTTVKEMIASLLKERFLAQVGKSYKNWNNALGLALSILSMTGQEDFWILELGVSEVGEMAHLGSIASPDIGVIVNVGHGVAQEKAALFDSLTWNGTAVISLDYPVLDPFFPKRDDVQVKTFSCHKKEASFFGREAGRITSGRLFQYILWAHGQEFSLNLPWPGMLENVLATAATLDALGMTHVRAYEGWDSVSLPEHRFHVQHYGSFVLIDDCYNANPLSMESALYKLEQLSPAGPFVLILGDMLELGECASGLHYQLGHSLARFQDIYVFYQGQYAKEVASGFAANQVDQHFFEIGGLDGFIAQWRTLDLESGSILIKGSRGCSLEDYVHALIQEIHQ
jgi:UDP-N-acetylmuramoyl-tripeptide--D-alanyl-D-alanine ligase